MRELLTSRTSRSLLTVFEKEGDLFGWCTAKECVNRIAKAKDGSPQMSNDARLVSMLKFLRLNKSSVITRR